MQNLISKQFNNQTITFDLSDDLLINLTEMAKPFGKKPHDFLELDQTKAFLTELAKSLNCFKSSQNGLEAKQYVITKHGGSNPGTWAHRKVAIKFAAWLSPELEVWMINQIDELLLKGSVSIQHTIPRTYSEALQLAADQAKQLEMQAPKVAYFDALVERNLLTNIRDTAKELHIKQNEFVKWLLDNHYVYRDAKQQLKPYSKYTPDLFELKEWANSSSAGNQVLITPKGRETFRLLLDGVAA